MKLRAQQNSEFIFDFCFCIAHALEFCAALSASACVDSIIPRCLSITLSFLTLFSPFRPFLTPTFSPAPFRVSSAPGLPSPIVRLHAAAAREGMIETKVGIQSIVHFLATTAQHTQKIQVEYQRHVCEPRIHRNNVAKTPVLTHLIFCHAPTPLPFGTRRQTRYVVRPAAYNGKPCETQRERYDGVE